MRASRPPRPGPPACRGRKGAAPGGADSWRACAPSRPPCARTVTAGRSSRRPARRSADDAHSRTRWPPPRRRPAPPEPRHRPRAAAASSAPASAHTPTHAPANSRTGSRDGSTPGRSTADTRDTRAGSPPRPDQKDARRVMPLLCSTSTSTSRPPRTTGGPGATAARPLPSATAPIASPRPARRPCPSRRSRCGSSGPRTPRRPCRRCRCRTASCRRWRRPPRTAAPSPAPAARTGAAT